MKLDIDGDLTYTALEPGTSFWHGRLHCAEQSYDCEQPRLSMLYPPINFKPKKMRRASPFNGEGGVATFGQKELQNVLP